MREEEEKMAEEGDVDEGPLTYDRPDFCNKVTLRRSSTGMWEVCSSGQNLENENGLVDNHKKKKKPVQCGDSENMDGGKNKRTLRSSRCEARADNVGAVRGEVDVTACCRNGNSPVEHPRSSRRACSRDCSVVVGLPSIQVINSSQCGTDVLAGVDSVRESRSSPSKPLKNSNNLLSNSNSTANDEISLDHTEESLSNNVSPINHKYPTRQKVAFYDAK